jgi:hypothetical protein
MITLKRFALVLILALSCVQVTGAASPGGDGSSSPESNKQAPEKPSSGGNAPDPSSSSTATAASGSTISASNDSRTTRNDSVSKNEEKSKDAVVEAIAKQDADTNVEAADAEASDKNIKRSKNTVNAGLTGDFVYKATFSIGERQAAHNRIIELAGRGNSPGGVAIYKSREATAMEREKSKKRAQGSKGGVGVSDPALGKVGEARTDYAVAKRYTVVALPNPIVMHYVGKRTELGLPAWTDGSISNSAMRDMLYKWARENILPVIAMISLGVLLIRFFWTTYNLFVSDRGGQAPRRMVMVLALFVLCSVMICFGHQALIKTRGVLSVAAIQLQMDFQDRLASEYPWGMDKDAFQNFLKSDSTCSTAMLTALSLAQQKEIVASTKNEDMTLSNRMRGDIEGAINTIRKPEDREAVYGDFCVLRLNLYNSYCAAVEKGIGDGSSKDAIEGAVNVDAKLAKAKDNFLTFLDQKALFSDSSVNRFSDVAATAFASTVNDLNAPFTTISVAGTFTLAYVASWIIAFCVDCAFIFILVSLPSRVITLENPLILLGPFLEVGALTFFSLCTMFFRALGLYFIFKGSASVLSMTFEPSAADDQPNEIYMWIGIGFLGPAQIFGSWILTKLCFPKVQLQQVAQSVYSGGAAVVGGVMGAASAAMGAVGAFTPAAPATSAAASAGGAASRSISSSGGRKGGE